MRQRTGSPTHLVRRFLWSLRPQEPDPDQEAWLLEMCSPAEQALYQASNRQDRAHALECAAKADELIRSEPDLSELDPPERRNVVVAAALHDVGKTPARLSTMGRVAATMAKPLVAERGDPSQASNLWQRFGLYKAHPQIGGALLRDAQSDPLVVAWAEQHHVVAADRTIDPVLARLLEQADE